MKKRSIIKSLLLTTASLVIGFIAIAFPFNLFKTLTGEAMQVLFISEIVIYSIAALIFLVVSDKRKQERLKSEKRHEARRQKIEQFQREWIDIAA